MRCLTVDSPSRLYLCGESGIPTHNTYALLLECIRNITNPQFSAIVFRRESKQIHLPGGLFDTAMEIYPGLGAKHRNQPMVEFSFRSGAKIVMTHLNQETDVAAFQGSQIPLLVWDELCHFCMTPDHDVLTEYGWQPITEVHPDTRVASLDVLSRVCFLPVSGVHRFDYDGEMIEWDGPISTIVTPNHQMLVTSNGKRDRWVFKRADEVENNTGYAVYRTGEAIEQSGIDRVYFDKPNGQGIGTNQNSVDSVSIEDYAELMGWYLSEGSAYISKTSPMVSIRQTKESQHLSDLMARIPWRVVTIKDSGYVICSRQLYNHLKPLGNVYQKRVPEVLFKQSSRVIKLFLHAFALGDGHFTPTGGIAFGLANEGLIDDLQALYTITGRVAVKSGPVVIEREGKQYTHWRLSVSKQSRLITQLRANGKRLQYSGEVWCLSVPGTHNFLVRRHGICHFTGNSKSQFFYMLSRNRSTCGIKPYVRASCNPDPDSWVAEFIAWWIDPKTGYPIPDRSGQLRYFIQVPTDNDTILVWGDTPDELAIQMGLAVPTVEARQQAHDAINSAMDQGRDPATLEFDDELAAAVRYLEVVKSAKSVTFIPGLIYDNPALLRRNPDYLANLKVQDRVQRARLLEGNWKVRPVAGDYFSSADARFVREVPNDVVYWVRSWDLAATEPNENNRDPDWTVGMKMGRRANGRVVIADVKRFRRNASTVRDTVYDTAQRDGQSCWIQIPRDPGQAGADQIESYEIMLAGFSLFSRPITRNKVTMAEPAAAEWQRGNIEMVIAPWNSEVLEELDKFPTPHAHDDCVDALSGGYNLLPPGGSPDYTEAGLRRRFALDNGR